jgi:hypothetical protein
MKGGEKMAQRSYDERIEEIIKKQEQLEAQRKALEKKQRADENKKHAKRLNEFGSIVEKILGRPVVDEDKIRFTNFLKKQEANSKYFTKAMNARKVTEESNAAN